MYCTNTYIHKTKKEKNTSKAAFNQNNNFIPYNRLKQQVRKSSNKIFQAQASSCENTHQVKVWSLKCFSALICLIYLQLTAQCWNFEMFFFLSADIRVRNTVLLQSADFVENVHMGGLGTSPWERKIFLEHSGDPEIAAWTRISS